jgi:hypothetical protein
MKLVIKRDQDKGIMGGVKFILNARVELTPEESELIKKYKAQQEVLMQGPSRFGMNMLISIGSLTSGFSQKCKDITEVLNTEETLKEVCGKFKTYLMVMASFGGEEVIEY